MAQKWCTLVLSVGKFFPLFSLLIGSVLMAAIWAGAVGFEALRVEQRAALELRLSASAAATEIDSALQLFVRRASNFGPADFVRSDRLGGTARVIRLQNAVPNAAAAFLVDAAGHLFAASAPFPLGESDVSNSEWFRRARGAPERTLTIERVDTSWLRLGPTIIVTLPIVQPSHTVAGLVGIVVPVGNLHALLSPSWLSLPLSLRLRDAHGQNLIGPPEAGLLGGVEGATESGGFWPRLLLSVAELTNRPHTIELVIPLQGTTVTVAGTIDSYTALLADWPHLGPWFGVLGLGLIGSWLVLVAAYVAFRAGNRRQLAEQGVPFGVDWIASLDLEGHLITLSGVAPEFLRRKIEAPFLSLLCAAETDNFEFARVETALVSRLPATSVTVAIGDEEAAMEFHTLTVTVDPLGNSFRIEGRNVTGQTRVAQAEAEVSEARMAIAGMARERDRVLAAVGHDVRTPMNSILGICSLLLAENMENEHRGWLEKIRGSCEVLLSMLNGLLEIASRNVVAAELQIDEIDIVSLARNVADVLAPQAQDKGLVFHAWIDETLVGYWQVDPTRLRQVLFNLLGNAIRYTSNGSVEMRVSLVANSEGHTVVRITVSDSGPGILPEDRQKIFERFKRGRNEDSDVVGAGLGLGLALCRENAELMGGNLTLDSSYGVGSEFTFEFPANRSTVQAMPFVGRNALILGFEAVLRERVRTHFDRLGFYTESADDGYTGPGIAARIVAQRGMLDVLVIDAAISGISAELVVERIRSMSLGDKTAIVAVTSSNTEREGISRLVDSTIPASEDLTTISDTVGSLLGKRSPLEIINSRPSRSGAGRILIVEDNKVNQSLLIAALSARGFSTIVAKNGEEGVRLASYDGFDAILMDLQMPGVDGFEATRRIRALPGSAKTIPIIAITAFSGALIHKRCLAAGFTNILEKPVNLDHLGRGLRRWINDNLREGDRVSSPTESVMQRQAADIRLEAGEGDIMAAFLACMVEDIGVDRTRVCLSEFVTEVASYGRQLHELLPGWEVKSIIRICHNLGALAANFGAVTLSDTFEELTLAAQNDAHDAAMSLVEKIEGLIGTVVPELTAKFDLIAASGDRKAA